MISNRKAAKKLIKVAKKHPEWYNEQEVWYANRIKNHEKAKSKKDSQGS